MPNNGDTQRIFHVNGRQVRGLGSFHKTLPHDGNGEVNLAAFESFVAATQGDGGGFRLVPEGRGAATQFTNPQAGLADDQLTHHPTSYSMPPAPMVLSSTAGAEMVELYWMSLLRDEPFDQLPTLGNSVTAAAEISARFHGALGDTGDPGRIKPGVDAPGSGAALATITADNLFRLGLPGEEAGPFVSQFFLRDIPYGTQTINQRQRPYAHGLNFLTSFPDWLRAQDTGMDADFQAYPKANEHSATNFEAAPRYIATLRDLARFVNKDALHQAYLGAALVLLNGGAKWTRGNPYSDFGPLRVREAGFGVLGGPHILALVSEVATRALKTVWNQKWQVHLRLRPEAYAGLVHVQELGGADGVPQPYGLPSFVASSTAAQRVRLANGSFLLPLAFTPGSPAHPAYGAGHATVAGACVTVLKAFFKTFDTVAGHDVPISFTSLRERSQPYGDGTQVKAYVSGLAIGPSGDNLTELPAPQAAQLTIEGELNKLAMNVAMGRSAGGVHWRTDNARSLVLGEALAAEILADITTDSNERPVFEFRTFSRRRDGQPKKVTIREGRIFVDGAQVDSHGSAL